MNSPTTNSPLCLIKFSNGREILDENQTQNVGKRRSDWRFSRHVTRVTMPQVPPGGLGQ